MPHIWKTAGLAMAKGLAACLRRLTPDEIEGLGHQFRVAVPDVARRHAAEIFARELISPSRGCIYDTKNNGEELLMRRTADLGFTTLFDVGANEGHWATEALENYPRAHIHCFEIVPSTFKVLQDRFAAEPRVVANAFGLGDQEGFIKVHVSSNSKISSMHKFNGSGVTVAQDCKIDTGAAYCQRHDISKIDFLKIDTEGGESKVLQGFRRLLDAGSVRLIQFEYNRGAIESRFLLNDFYKFFGEVGYAVGRLTGRGVEFRDYHYSQEDFAGPNYVACPATDRALIEAISVR